MTSHLPDDGFHEIQLNGKQLVFLFMAATVVSVVIFLCGVLVGRGVRAERGAAAEAAALADAPIADTRAASAPPAPAGSDPRVAAPPAAVDDLTYFNRLEKPQPAAEELKPPPSPPAASAGQGRTVSPAASTRTAATAQPATSPEYAVQLAALNSRTEADAMAKRLAAKGYEAYVQAPADGAPAIYRVRVGSYPTRREAETVAAKLEREGQFKPWIARR